MMLLSGALLNAFLFIGNTCAAQLQLVITQNRVELGQVLHGKLIAIDSPATLSDIDLAPLQNNFVVQSHEGELTAAESQRYPKENVQVLALELYPRHTGKLVIPTLHLDEAQSGVQTILVDNAVESDGAITVELQVSQHRVWQRQQLIVTVAVTSPQSFFTLETAPYKSPGFEILPQQVIKQTVQVNSRNHTRVSTGWVLFPLLAGNYKLDLPMIGYRQSGRVQRQFALPQIALDVHKLPSYIPPNMPVARVNVDASIQPTGVLGTDTLAYWTVTLSANGTLPVWLPPVLQDLRSENGIHFLPQQSRRSLQVSANGAHATVVHQIPFTAQYSGKAQLPALKVQYFDPRSGRIESLRYRSPQPLVMGSTLLILLGFILVITLVWIMRLLIHRGNRYISQRRQLRQAFSSIRQAETASGIIRGLRQYAAAQGWHANLCMTDFVSKWRQHYQLSEAMLEALHDLSQCAYSRHTTELSVSDLRIIVLINLRSARKLRTLSHGDGLTSL